MKRTHFHGTLETTLALALLGALGASAKEYRILFRGQPELAAASSVAPRGAGYIAPQAGNLSAADPRCVPGSTSAPYHGAGVPNQIVTFLHPYTNRAITIPLTLPVGKPTIVTKRDRIVYDYGWFAQKVVVKFRSDGMVEVIYRD